TRRAEKWATVMKPVDPIEAWFVGQLAVESVRVERCQGDERVLMVRQALHAESGWDEDRRLAAEELGAGLSNNPALVVRRLRQTSQGCDWLVEHWQGLERALKAEGRWDDRQRALALDLLGVSPELRDGPTPLDPSPGDDTPAASFQAGLVA